MSTRPDRLPIPRQYLPVAIGAGLIILAMIGLITLQLATQPRALQITPIPTLGMDRTSVLVSAPPVQPTGMPAPTALPEPTTAPAPTAPPQTGRGLGVEPESAPAIVPVVEAAPAEAAPATYLDNVGAQAPHCVRDCDGQPGQKGGDYVIVPTLAPDYARTIGEQAPHKIR